MKIKTDLQVTGTTTFDVVPSIPTTALTSDNMMVSKKFVDTHGRPGHFRDLHLGNYSLNDLWCWIDSITLANSSNTNFHTINDFWVSQSLDLSQQSSVGVKNGIYSHVLYANHTYHIYAISNGSDYGLWVDDRATPIPPSDYTYYRWISTLMTGSAGWVDSFDQFDGWVYYNNCHNILNSGHATSLTYVSCASFIPTNAVQALIFYYGVQSGSGGGILYLCGIWGGLSYGYQDFTGIVKSPMAFGSNHYFRGPDTPYVYYHGDNSNIYTYLWVDGYLLPL